MMSQCYDAKHALLRRQLMIVLRSLGQELLPEDQLIADAFLGIDSHISVADLHASLVSQHPELDITHVRRTLRFLCELGIARRVKLDERTVYEHLHPDEHHDHLLCMRCGAIEEFVSDELEEEQLAACRSHHFQPLMHTLVIRGICQACADHIPSTRSLATCLPGETVIIEEVLGGQGIKQRLHDLGFLRDTRIRILQNDGPVALEIKGGRLAIGRGEAAKVIVRQPDTHTEG